MNGRVLVLILGIDVALLAAGVWIALGWRLPRRRRRGGYVSFERRRL